MKSDYKYRAMRFIYMVYPYIKDCHTPREYQRAILSFNKDFHRKVIVCSGLTRVALITSDYVIKIDYGTEGQYYGTCERELQVYKHAEEEGYAYLLAKISKVYYARREWYIMPRVYGIGRREEDVYEYVNEEECDWLINNIADVHNLNYGWCNGYPLIFDYACPTE